VDSKPYVDVALICMREPRLVETNNAISDDVASRDHTSGTCASERDEKPGYLGDPAFRALAER
jgi:hypothetical protein